MKIGLTQGTAEVEAGDFISFAALSGITGVEPYIGDARSPYLSWSSESIEQWRRHANAMNVTIPSVAMSVFNGDDSLVNGKDSEDAIQLIGRALHFAKTLNAKRMLLCAYLASDPDTAEKRRNLMRVVRAVEPEARRLAVSIALEAPLPAEQLASMIDQVGSDSVGVYYDTGNAVAMGFNPAKELQILRHRVLGLHIKDSINRLGGLHLGEGSVEFDQVFSAVTDIGYEGWLMLETPGDIKDRVVEDIKRCLAYLILELDRHGGPAYREVAEL